MKVEMAFETLFFFKRFRCRKKILAISHAVSSKPSIAEFYVNAGAWESYRRVNQAALWFVP
jgi:hypothetical protein